MLTDENPMPTPTKPLANDTTATAVLRFSVVLGKVAVVVLSIGGLLTVLGGQASIDGVVSGLDVLVPDVADHSDDGVHEGAWSGFGSETLTLQGDQGQLQIATDEIPARYVLDDGVGAPVRMVLGVVLLLSMAALGVTVWSIGRLVENHRTGRSFDPSGVTAMRRVAAAAVVQFLVDLFGPLALAIARSDSTTGLPVSFNAAGGINIEFTWLVAAAAAVVIAEILQHGGRLESTARASAEA